jgi:TonB family protein
MLGQTLAGRVLDGSTRAPLIRVEIKLLSDSGGLEPVLARATTDSAGVFYLDAPAPGSYRISFNLPNSEMLLAKVSFKAKEEVQQRDYLLDLAPTSPPAYFEFQVDMRVTPRPTNPAPQYPDRMRRAYVEGEVLVQFVVDTLGHPEMGTLKILRSTYLDFTNAVRQVLPGYEFLPAELKGRKVKQLAQVPFEFCLEGAIPPLPDTGELWWLRQRRPTACRHGP